MKKKVRKKVQDYAKNFRRVSWVGFVTAAKSVVMTDYGQYAGMLTHVAGAFVWFITFQAFAAVLEYWSSG
ncbi:MAG: hypothetical protein ACYDEV_01305 [Acidiferrobacter sp.]